MYTGHIASYKGLKKIWWTVSYTLQTAEAEEGSQFRGIIIADKKIFCGKKLNYMEVF